MGSIWTAITAALHDLREPRVLALGLVPPLAAIAAWIVLAWAFADDWARWVSEWLAAAPWLTWVGSFGLSSVFVFASGIAAFALVLPVMLIAAVLATELVAMPVIVPWIADRHFPGLAQRRGGTVAGSAVNAVKAIVVFAALWLATLPLWLTGVGALVLPPLLAAQFNQRMFGYDALAEHASAEEYAAIVKNAGGRLFLLGWLLALLYFVPFVNLAVPVLSALAYTHFCLGELARLRQGIRSAV